MVRAITCWSRWLLCKRIMLEWVTYAGQKNHLFYPLFSKMIKVWKYHLLNSWSSRSQVSHWSLTAFERVCSLKWIRFERILWLEWVCMQFLRVIGEHQGFTLEWVILRIQKTKYWLKGNTINDLISAGTVLAEEKYWYILESKLTFF